MQTKILNLYGILFLICFCTAAAGPATAAGERFLTLATGPLTGVYYPAGRAVCSIVTRRMPNVHCVAQRTAGSGANMERLSSGAADLAIVQNDVARARRSLDFGQIARLHRDFLTVVVRADDPAQSLGELPLRKLYTGSPGSGHRASATAIAKTLKRRLAKPPPSQSDLISPPLCAGSIRGLMLMVGHPAGMVQEAVRSCNARLIGLSHDMAAQLIASNPVYVAATIPAGLYRGQDEPVSTIGQDAILVARMDLPAEVVARLLSAIDAGLPRFRAAHPALSSVSRERLRSLDTALPVHPGAANYYTARP